jgi:hypothetical protein
MTSHACVFSSWGLACKGSAFLGMRLVLGRREEKRREEKGGLALCWGLLEGRDKRKKGDVPDDGGNISN